MRHQKCDKHEQTVVNAYYDRLVEDWKTEQVRYDEETDHCRNKQQQADWQTKLASELAR